MKLTIERAVLLKSLAHVQSVVERRNTIPILSNVKLESHDGTLGLNATDMDIEIQETVSAEVMTPGVATAPAHTLYEIVRKLPDGSQIDMEFSDQTQQLLLRSGRSKFTLSCLPVEDFPQISGGELPYRFALTADALKGLFARAAFAMSTEETRYYLNGIYMHPAQSEGVPVLRTAATDGHRLARVETPLPEGASGMPGIIVPRKTVTELSRLLDESVDEVQISVSDAKIRFSLGSVVMTSKLIDGTFPDYERVIPAGNDKAMEVGCKQLAQAVDRVSAISTEKSRAIKMVLTSGVVTLSASSAENSSAVEEIEASYGMDRLEIGFNARYLLDILTQIEGDAVRFLLADAVSPTIVREVSEGNALYVLMPMRV